MAATVVVAPDVGGGLVGSGAAPERRAQDVLTPVVLAESAIVRPSGIAPLPDGSFYVSEAGSSSLYRVDPDGVRTLLDLDLEHPTGLHLEPDGTLYVADGTRVTTVAPDGTQGTIPVDGARNLQSVGVDASGAVYVVDTDPWEVVRRNPDDTQEVLDVGGATLIGGLGVAADGTVTVLNIETGVVIRRAPDGTITEIPVDGAEAGRSVDAEGDTLVVGGPAGVLLRQPDGTVTQVIDVGGPNQVDLRPDGTIWTAGDGITGCRCPDPAGTAYRRDPGAEARKLPLGDLADFGAVAAAEPGTALYTSWSGPQAYSELNPLRQVTDDGASTDLPVDDAAGVDAAPDGTAYLTLLSNSDQPPKLVRRDPDGTTTAIDVPTESGMTQLVDLSVDEDGRVFAALGSGYGTGPFMVIELLPDGGARTWYRSPEMGQYFLAMAAGGGTVQIALNASTGPEADPRLLVLTEPDKVGADRPLAGLADVMDVDADGNAYLVRYTAAKANTAVIDVLRADGTTGSLTYVGIASPRSLSAATDGTLYVADTGLGVIALFDAVAIASDDVGPPEAAPADPVSGQAAFTG